VTPVKLVSTGTIQIATDDGLRTGAAAGIAMLGIFMGCEYKDSLGKTRRFSSSGPPALPQPDIVAYVIDDPEALFDVQYTNPGTAGTDSVQTYVGRECDWTPAASGSTSTGLSATYLSAVQSTSGQFQIYRFLSINVKRFPDRRLRHRHRAHERVPVQGICQHQSPKGDLNHGYTYAQY